MDIQLSNNQRLLLAQLIKNDIARYVSEHQEEYNSFLASESNDPHLKVNVD